MNIIGMQALYIKEVTRFFRVYHQTIIAPVVNAILFFSVFTLAFGGNRGTGFAVPYETIVASGLIIMSALQNAYSNTLSSVGMSRVLGYLTDYIVPPLGKSSIIIAMVGSAVTRGIVVAIATAVVMVFFANIHFYNIFILLFYVIISCILFSFLGIIFGSLSSSFDKSTAFTNYFITPLLFLSGTFYSIKNLPEVWQKIIAFNPVFYMIDGFRYSVTGFNDSNLLVGMIYISIMTIILMFISIFCLEKYYKVRGF